MRPIDVLAALLVMVLWGLDFPVARPGWRSFRRS